MKCITSRPSIGVAGGGGAVGACAPPPQVAENLIVATKVPYVLKFFAFTFYNLEITLTVWRAVDIDNYFLLA